MHILLTNDDGFDAAGIVAMREELVRRGHDITVVAPFKQMSGASHSITIHVPLRVDAIEDGVFAVHGTPVDCITLACEALVKTEVDLVVSGINGGQNMCQDVLYSGTVAAAIEAMIVGWRAIATSAFGYHDQDYESAAWHTAELIDRGIASLIAPDEILNVNCPNLPREAVRGYKVTRPGNRFYDGFVREELDVDGHRCFIVGGNMPRWEQNPDTDYHEVHAGFVSISPVFPAFHKQSADQKVSNWLNAQGLLREV
ncbi:MAG: 5'/3'-nucleotidase SurE [Candidatus Cloacimonetes bacterium]|nr:5'/3'-nucleotidase SurE [Candidatus Cloacimonadota bacterium]